MTRKEPVQGHRERLLAGALTCLQEKGYARTTARDLVAASGTNLASIGYHFGGKEALLNEALTECFRSWTSRVEEAVFGSAGATPRDLLERALTAIIDGFEEVRPMVLAFVEAFPPALRDEQLRAVFAASYAETRRAGTDMITRACAELGIEPAGLPETLASVLIALADGLMLQWLLDPAATPDSRQVLDTLTALAPLLATG